MANTEKQEYAKILYTGNVLSKEEISEKLEISAQQLNNWIKEGLWQELHTLLLTTKDQQLQLLYEQLNNLNRAIMAGKGYPTAQEACSLKVLTQVINNLETTNSIGSTICVGKEFTAWLRKKDNSLGKTVTVFFDTYIKQKIKEQ